MGLINEKTGWLFFLPSSSSAEPRHVLDIALGVDVLLRRSIPLENIVLLIDGCPSSLLESAFSSLKLPVPTKVFHTSDYCQLLQKNTYDNIVIFVTGHGGIDGIDSKPPIKPYVFYQSLKNAPNLKNAVVYFGQCQDGVYNHVSLKTDVGGLNNCKIVAVGASGLHNSVSDPSIIGGMWAANIFLTFLFTWIMKPVDVDGDGNFSVVDSYKYATINTYDLCRKLECAHEIKDMKAKLALASLKEDIEKKCKDGKPTADQELQIKAIETTINSISFDQTPWILNVFAGMNIFY